jgi:ATP-dependent helicase HepA
MEYMMVTRNQRQFESMLKKLVRHEQFGEGRIISADKALLRVIFFKPDGIPFEQGFARDAIRRGILHANILERGRVCAFGDGQGEVLRALPLAENEFQTYEVLTTQGVSAVYSEADLDPVIDFSETKPSTRLAGREFSHLAQFRSRESFRTACIRNFRQGGKLTALLSARIDLLPHQAFVAGTILDDRRKRYILADEVGLGKTVEAGIVIHDLLSGNPEARVLIVCPGTLTEQWLCEIYSKFGGQVFTLIDLHAESEIQWDQTKHVIVSTAQVLQFASKPILDQMWDLAVIDECHHLLSAPYLYEFASKLSRRAKSLLLLSAIPAQQKEEEYFKLLALLEPDRFSINRLESFEEFKTMYDSQASLSRRLQPLIIRIRGFATEEYSFDDVVKQVARLLELPMLAADERLKTFQTDLSIGGAKAIGTAQLIVDHVADRYRLYRRILRNRRKALQSEAKLEVLVRERYFAKYHPGPLEEQACRSVDALLQSCFRNASELDLAIAFARIVWQSLASSDCALELLRHVPQGTSLALNESGKEFLALGYLVGYDDWATYCPLLQQAAASFVDADLLATTLRHLQFWADSDEQSLRYRTLKNAMNAEWQKKSGAKLLLFAGYPDLAEEVEVALSSEFGEGVVLGFRSDMSRAQKEEAAQRFRNNCGAVVLVSDESGGEGRNFEFADAVLHYDTPFQVARIEQRIGRLDRIGRSKMRGDVRSVVICAQGTVEEALVRCYDEGVNVYRESVSGLEFSLRDQELRICTSALEGGIESLTSLIEPLKEISDRERDRDEYDALLDWASYNEDRAQRFLSVRSKPDIEAAVESGFIEYFQSLSKTKAVKPYSDKKSSAGLWEFNIDSLRSGVLSSDAAGTLVGTFKRDIALSRFDRTFLQIGNPFFDAVDRASRFHPALRTYAVQCRAANNWIGFEFVYSAQPDSSQLRGRPDLHTLIESFFSMAPVHVFVDLAGVEGDQNLLRNMRQSLTRENKDKTWVNLWHDRERVLNAYLPESTWAAQVSEIEAKALEIARARLSERMAPIEDLKTRWTVAAKAARETGAPISIEEADTLDLLISSVSHWTAYQESAGFFAASTALGRSL